MNLTLCIIYFIVSIGQLVSSFFLVANGSRCRKTYMFLGCQLTSILWCFSQVYIYIAENITQLWMAYNVGNFSVCFLGTFWMGFCVCFAQKDYKRTVAAFCVSVFHYIMILTNPLHHLYYKTFELGNIRYGAFFYSNVIFSYFCICVGIGWLAQAKTWEKNQRYQKKILILSALFPWVLNILHQIKFINTAFDITPLGFCLSYLLILVATFRYNFLDINQLAFEQVMEEIQDGVVIFRFDDTCSFRNSAVKAIFPEKSLKTKGDFYENFTEKQRGELQEKGEIIFQTCRKYYHIQSTIHYERNNQAAVSFVVKDVSRYYERMEQTKRISVLEQTLAVEQEKSHMIQQVHDTTGHTFTIIRSLLKLAQTSIDAMTTKEYLVEADKVVKQGIRELREYILQTRKEEKHGLITKRILQLADTIKEIPVEITIVGEDDKKYSYLTETIFICVKECITNTLKYAGAENMEIILKFCEDAIEVYIFDDGQGCEQVEYGNGLQGIYKRVKEKQGTLKISSEPGDGFQVVIKIPLNT